MMKCSACGEQFRGVSGFDAHRVGRFAKSRRGRGNRRCLTKKEIAKLGLVLNKSGAWSRPRDEDGKSPTQEAA